MDGWTTAHGYFAGFTLSNDSKDPVPRTLNHSDSKNSSIAMKLPKQKFKTEVEATYYRACVSPDWMVHTAVYRAWGGAPPYHRARAHLRHWIHHVRALVGQATQRQCPYRVITSRQLTIRGQAKTRSRGAGSGLNEELGKQADHIDMRRRTFKAIAANGNSLLAVHACCRQSYGYCSPWSRMRFR